MTLKFLGEDENRLYTCDAARVQVAMVSNQRGTYRSVSVVRFGSTVCGENLAKWDVMVAVRGLMFGSCYSLRGRAKYKSLYNALLRLPHASMRHGDSSMHQYFSKAALPQKLHHVP